MISNKKRREVFNILMMPIECTGYSDKNPKIEIVDSVIKTTQTYYSILDEDMSDIALGFYEIIYQDILKGKTILNDKDGFTNQSFAGDTMNSFNYIANTIPEAGESKDQRTDQNKWPLYLQEYYQNYHCLANFWILPMELGRSGKKWCKGSFTQKVNDYMDRFLKLLKNNYENYKKNYKNYFDEIGEFDQFVDVHFLLDSYTNKEFKIFEYSNNSSSSKSIVENINNLMEKRAKTISESRYAKQLWTYFNELELYK